MAKSRIIKELANNDISIDIALSRVLIIASDIDNNELSEWAEKELNGYSAKDKVPDYRIAKNSLFKYSGISGNFQVTNAPLPLMQLLEGKDPSMFYMPIKDGIRSIEDFVHNQSGNEYGMDITWAAGHVYKLSGIQCYSIRQIVPVNVMEIVVNSLKTILMKILIQLDKSFGSLDDLDIDTGKKTPEELQSINTTINNYICVDSSIKIGDKNKIENTDIETRD